MAMQGMELCAVAVVILLFIAVLKQFGILEPISAEAATATWSSRPCGTNLRGWSSCRHRPSSPRRSCSPSTAASRASAPAAGWTRRPSRSSTRSSSRRATPAPTLTSCSTPSTPTAAGRSASRTSSAASPFCCGGRCRRS